jgi:hypothetical protein
MEALYLLLNFVPSMKYGSSIKVFKSMKGNEICLQLVKLLFHW